MQSYYYIKCACSEWEVHEWMRCICTGYSLGNCGRKPALREASLAAAGFKSHKEQGGFLWEGREMRPASTTFFIYLFVDWLMSRSCSSSIARNNCRWAAWRAGKANHIFIYTCCASWKKIKVFARLYNDMIFVYETWIIFMFIQASTKHQLCNHLKKMIKLDWRNHVICTTEYSIKEYKDN